MVESRAGDQSAEESKIDSTKPWHIEFLLQLQTGILKRLQKYDTKEKKELVGQTQNFQDWFTSKVVSKMVEMGSMDFTENLLTESFQ